MKTKLILALAVIAITVAFSTIAAQTPGPTATPAPATPVPAATPRPAATPAPATPAPVPLVLPSAAPSLVTARASISPALLAADLNALPATPQTLLQQLLTFLPMPAGATPDKIRNVTITIMPSGGANVAVQYLTP